MSIEHNYDFPELEIIENIFHKTSDRGVIVEKYLDVIEVILENMKSDLYYGQTCLSFLGQETEEHMRQLSQIKDVSEQLSYIYDILDELISKSKKSNDRLDNKVCNAIKFVVLDSKGFICNLWTFKKMETVEKAIKRYRLGKAYQVGGSKLLRKIDEIYYYEYFKNLFLVKYNVEQYHFRGNPLEFGLYIFQSVFDCLIFADSIDDLRIRCSYLKFCLEHLEKNSIYYDNKDVLEKEIEKIENLIGLNLLSLKPENENKKSNNKIQNDVETNDDNKSLNIKWLSVDTDLYYLIRALKLKEQKENVLKDFIFKNFIDKKGKSFSEKNNAQGINNLITNKNKNKSRNSILIDKLLKSSINNGEIVIEDIILNLVSNYFIRAKDKDNLLKLKEILN